MQIVYIVQYYIDDGSCTECHLFGALHRSWTSLLAANFGGKSSMTCIHTPYLHQIKVLKEELKERNTQLVESQLNLSIAEHKLVQVSYSSGQKNVVIQKLNSRIEALEAELQFHKDLLEDFSEDQKRMDQLYDYVPKQTK